MQERTCKLHWTAPDVVTPSSSKLAQLSQEHFDFLHWNAIVGTGLSCAQVLPTVPFLQRGTAFLLVMREWRRSLAAHSSHAKILRTCLQGWLPGLSPARSSSNLAPITIG